MDTQEEPKVTTTRLNFNNPKASAAPVEEVHAEVETPHVPNAETVEALEASEAGEVETVETVDELFAEDAVCEECQIGGPAVNQEAETPAVLVEAVDADAEPSKTVADLEAEREALDRKIEEQKAAEKRSVMDQIANVMGTYAISLEELVEYQGGLKIKRKGVKAKPKFRDPVTGAIWTGRGKPPVWLRDKNFDDYLIPKDEVETASAGVDSATTETAAV